MSLIKTIEEVRKYLSVDNNLQWDDFKPYIDKAEREYIKPLLGDFYTVLLTDYTEGTDDTGIDDTEDEMVEANLTLMPFVQMALAKYAVYHSLNPLGTSIGSTGIQEQFGQNSRPAPRWKLHELQLQLIQEADKEADQLLQYLEENASITIYTEWFNDAVANTSISGTIVHKTSIASQFIDIGESRRLFLKLKKFIKIIEATEVKAMLCKDQYDELVEQLKDDDVSEDNQAIIDLLQPYISKKALWLAIPSLRINITPEGITIHSTNDGVVSKTAASDKMVSELRKTLKCGEDYGFESDYRKLDQFIIDNIADYPLISESPCWASKSTSVPRYKPDNSPSNKHFSV